MHLLKEQASMGLYVWLNFGFWCCALFIVDQRISAQCSEDALAWLLFLFNSGSYFLEVLRNSCLGIASSGCSQQACVAVLLLS